MSLSGEIDIKLCQNYTDSLFSLYYVTRTSANSSAVSFSRVSRDQCTALPLAEVLVTFGDAETGDSQVSAYTPFPFSFTVPLKKQSHNAIKIHDISHVDLSFCRQEFNVNTLIRVSLIGKT